VHSVVETSSYLRAAKNAGMADEDMAAAVQLVSRSPQAGVIIEGTGGARKVRLAGRGKGKSGGYRIITYFCTENVPVFLLDVFSQGDKVNLTRSGVSN
jgi:hypothetical protein